MTAPIARRASRLAFALGLMLSPILSFGQSQPSLVERGEYLARAGDCVSCHTATGGAPFAGGLRLDTPFGYMLSPNITPDRDTGIGRWSSADFYRALHHGVNKHGQDMYPTMPYDFYTRVTRADVDALWAYLRSLKPVKNAVVVNHLDFPFNVRLSMGVWRELYFKEGTYRADPTKTASWNRGAYLVEGLGHCSDCHSPRNLLGGIEKSKQFQGAVIDGWFALDLTSDISTGLGVVVGRRARNVLQDGGCEGQDDDPRADGRSHPQQPELSHRGRSARDGGVLEDAAAGVHLAHRARRAGPDQGARRSTLYGQLQRLPPGPRPRRSRACSRRSQAIRSCSRPTPTTS